jgi:hypothetical protein
VRTDPIIPSAPSATKHMERAKPSSARTGTGALIGADDADGADAKADHPTDRRSLRQGASSIIDWALGERRICGGLYCVDPRAAHRVGEELVECSLSNNGAKPGFDGQCRISAQGMSRMKIAGGIKHGLRMLGLEVSRYRPPPNPEHRLFEALLSSF